MDISSPKFNAWKNAETELADIERRFRAMALDLSPDDRERVTRQLAALKAARLRVQLLFEEVMNESAALVKQMAADEAHEATRDDPMEPASPSSTSKNTWLL